MQIYGVEVDDGYDTYGNYDYYDTLEKANTRLKKDATELYEKRKNVDKKSSFEIIETSNDTLCFQIGCYCYRVNIIDVK